MATQAYAIDETESLRQRSQDLPSFTSMSLDLSGKRGNSRTDDLELGAYHSIRDGDHFAFIMASREYSTSNGVESANNAFGHLRYNYYFSEKESIELYLQSNVDDFRSLESRNLAGLAYRFEFDKDSAFGIGAFREFERYDVEQQTVDFNQTRVNLYWVVVKQISDHGQLSNTLYYQPNISEISDWRAFNKLNIRAKFTDKLSLNFSVQVQHDSQPVLNVESTDVSYSAGFEYDF